MALTILDRTPADEGDPIDLQLHQLGAAPASLAPGLPWYTRAGIGWSAGAPPLLLLLLIGAALGPGGLAVLTPNVLAAIDPAVPVALAVLGVHLSLHVDVDGSRGGIRLLALAGVESLLTAATVVIGLLILLSPDLTSVPFHTWLIALAAGVCASMSAPAPPAAGASGRRHNVDLLIATVLGGALLAWVREGSVRDSALMLAQLTLLPLIVALAAWLLIAPNTSEIEGRIFSLAALLLLGGLADFLSLSALFSGLIAGWAWRVSGGAVRETMQRDIGYLQHPLLVLLLLVAGSRMTMSNASLTLVVAYVLLRAAGKLTGGLLARRLWPQQVTSGFPLALLAPGAFGVAFAMSTVRAAGPQADPLLGAVVLGTIVSQILAAMTRGQEDAA